MASVNKVIIVGNLGADPETRYLPSGEAVTNIRVATTDRWKDKQSGEMKEATEWHRIAFFGRLAEVAGEYLKKGSQVYVEGSLRTRKWQDKEGQDRYSTEIRGDVMQMLGRREERSHAREEGVNFLFLTIPLRFVGDEEGRVTGLECQKMALGEPDESGRRRPVPVPHSEFIVPADSVAIAIGYNADPIIKDAAPGVATNRWNLVEVDRETGMTTREGVFAGGDNVNGADLVVTALADGRRAANAIHEYLQTKYTLTPNPF